MGRTLCWTPPDTRTSRSAEPVAFARTVGDMTRRALLKTASVEPIDPAGTRVLAVGTVLWAIALIGTMVFRQQLAADGNGWWLWTCLAGVLFGLVGVGFFARRVR